MIDFTEYWTLFNHVRLVSDLCWAAVLLGLLLGLYFVTGMFCFCAQSTYRILKSLAIVLFAVGLTGGLICGWMVRPALDDRINTVYGIRLAQAEDGECGNLHKLTRKPDNLICEVNYFKDNKPSSGKLIIQGNKVGLTDSQGAYLKETGR